LKVFFFGLANDRNKKWRISEFFSAARQRSEPKGSISFLLFNFVPPHFTQLTRLGNSTVVSSSSLPSFYPPPTRQKRKMSAAYSPLNHGGNSPSSSPSSLNPRNASPRLLALFGGVCVLGFLLWPSATSSLPNLSELSPTFANPFIPSSNVTSSRVVDLSTEPVPIAEDAVLLNDKWWQDISIVYTWVNGSETSFLEDKEAVTGEGVGSNRFRDDGLFKYSVRSIEQYLPWHTGEIILLSRRNHVPNWIDISQPRLV